MRRRPGLKLGNSRMPKTEMVECTGGRQIQRLRIRKHHPLDAVGEDLRERLCKRRLGFLDFRILNGSKN